MADKIRWSAETQNVIEHMLASPTNEFYGLELMKACDLKSGTMYRILRRLRDAGWLESRKEPIDPITEGRPARTYYKLTAPGVIAAQRQLDERTLAGRRIRPGLA